MKSVKKNKEKYGNIENIFHFSFFGVYVFDNNKRPLKIFFFMKYWYFNSILNATHYLRIHRTILNKLQFEKKLKIF